ncbi:MULTISPECIES: L-fucose:H+ symporter permease [unclassified Spirosoma]|uniref:L-fucose:H+ symporter permease n=1 Tax=unclassified Spirosoma TaxID=2621999 RepID=UPI0009622970|nr:MULTISPECIES: L-fucose:H+ symporter permease [unclassified Spirosoma]MBN8824883.1 L-fucose:H+ symporter permease [Spirosoma sp.]OJW74791.1 MAG: L-fucose:H+ symporter permease [Spirosoma sp. 48-14]
MKTSSRFVVPLLVVMSLMFIWNLSRNINDVLIPHLKRACQLTDLQSSLVQTAFFGGYFLLALPVGQFIQRYGYRAGMVTGLLTAALGAGLFFPAAETRYYPLFLGALFIMAAGFTFLEVTATPYISVLGDPERASSRLSLASAVGSLGATLGPLVGAQFLLHAQDIPEASLQQLKPDQLTAFLNAEAQLVKTPYLCLAILFLVLGLCLLFIPLPTLTENGETSARLKDILGFRHTVLGALGVFCYLGAEVGIVSFLIRYARSEKLPGLSEQKAALFITLFMALVLLGRLAGAWLLQQVDSARLLTRCAAGAGLLVIIAMLTTGYVSLYALSCVGLFTSVMYPILFTLSIHQLGAYTKTGSSLLIMSIVGGALIPPIMGLISDTLSIRLAFTVPVLCYSYILYYGLRGYITSQPVRTQTILNH